MKYENELMELIPMLKSYLKKVKSKYSYIGEEEDVFQECMLSAIESSGKRETLENPRGFFFSVFDRTIKRIGKKKLKEYYENNTMIENAVERFNKDICFPIISEIDRHVSKKSDVMNSIWEGLKFFEGNCTKVSRMINMTPQYISVNKRKIRAIYEDVKKEFNFSV